MTSYTLVYLSYILRIRTHAEFYEILGFNVGLGRYVEVASFLRNCLYKTLPLTKVRHVFSMISTTFFYDLASRTVQLKLLAYTHS